MAGELTAEEIYALFCLRGFCSDNDHAEIKAQHMRKIRKRLEGGWHVDWEQGKWDRHNANRYWERKVP